MGCALVKVTLDRVSKAFGSNTVVKDLSLEIADKEFFILLGPSGCGKTTTLNIIAGLEKATGGHVYFDGTMVDDLPPERRDIAMVFQSYALYPHMSAYDNIAFSLKIRKTPANEIKERVKETADLIHISHLLDRKPYELSGGERQRVALARGIVRRPKVFLLDEPMSNLDAKLRVAMRAELIRLQKMLETTTVYVTHDQVEAMTMADRIALMKDGKLMQIDAPLNIFNCPANLFVGGFIGSPSMNFLECEVYVNERGEAQLKSPSVSIPIREGISRMIHAHASTNEVIVGARPQHISVSRERVKDSMECEVYAIEPLGTETIVDLKASDAIVRAVTDSGFQAHIGDRVWAAFEIDQLHVFDKKSEELIV